MAVCYYYPRPGKLGLDAFVEADNSAYTEANKGGTFQELLRTLRQRNPAYWARAPLLVAPGADRRYFTDDDIVNW